MVEEKQSQGRTMEDVEEELQATRDPIARVKLFATFAQNVVFKDIHQATALLEELLPVARKLQRRGEVRKEFAMLLRASGLRHAIRGEFDMAEQEFTEALMLSQKLGEHSMVAYFYNSLGAVANSRGEYTKALELYQKSSEMLRKQEDFVGVIKCMSSIASAYSRMGNLVKGRDHFLEAAKLAEEIGDKIGHSNALAGAGTSNVELGNISDALELLMQSLRIKEELGDDYGIAIALASIGNAYAILEDHREALKYYERALVLEEKTGNQKSISASLINMGERYHFLGEEARAEEFLTRGITLAERIGDRNFLATGLLALSAVAAAQKKPAAAVEFAEQALAGKLAIRDRQGECYARMALANALASAGKHSEAIETALTAVAIGEELTIRPAIAQTSKFLSEFYRKIGDLEKALHWFERYHAINVEVLRSDAERKIEDLKARFEREQSEKREALLRVENERIERELDLNQKHLTTMAMSIVQHSNFLTTIGKEIGAAAKSAPKSRKPALDTLSKRVRQQSQAEQEWKQFEEQLENLDHDFMASLARRFPELSPTEIKICALIRVGLSSKDMAKVLCVTIRSIETYRLRVRKKLKLTADSNLASFLTKSN